MNSFQINNSIPLIVRNIIVFFIFILGLALCGLVLSLEKRLPNRDYSEFYNNINDKEVASVDFTGSRADVTLHTGFKYQVRVPDPASFIKIAKDKEVWIAFHEDYTLYFFQGGIFVMAASLAFVIWISIISASRNAKNSSFVHDKQQSNIGTSKRITFDDVAGVPEAKEELREVVSFLKNPTQFKQLGAIIPKGLLLQGPPGTGKTLIAKAVAGEAGVPFYSFSGSDFVEVFVGVGAARVRDLFNEAKKNTPCIVFIDEIDAVGGNRNASFSDGQDERGQTLNALLVEMDGFSSHENIIVLAATNRPDILDPALRRPGRFDRQITLLPPNLKGRLKILEVHCKKVVLDEDVELENIARITAGFTGAELANLVNEAALLAGRANCRKISTIHFDLARDRITLGVERKGIILTDKDKTMTAFHEAGHAILAKILPESDPIHKISIIPRGRALGQTQQLQLNDLTAYTREYLTHKITILLGGRAAEEIIFHKLTTRSENDLFQATEIATNMVCRWGMSNNLGSQAFLAGSSGFIHDGTGQRMMMSDHTASMIDKEIKTILSSCYLRALDILKTERQFLESLAEILVQIETLDAEEFDIIYQCSIAKKDVSPQEDSEVESECVSCPVKGQCLKQSIHEFSQ